MACVCEVFGEARGARYCPNPREESGASREIGYISYIMVRLCGVVRSGDDEISVDKQLRWFNRGSSYSGMLGAQGQGYEWVCAVVFAGLCGHPRYCWFQWFWPWLWLWLAAETGRAVTSRCCSARPARAPMAAPPFQGLLTMKKKPTSKLPHSRVRGPHLGSQPLLRDMTCPAPVSPFSARGDLTTGQAASWLLRSPLEEIRTPLQGETDYNATLSIARLSIAPVHNSEAIPDMPLLNVPSKFGL